MKLIIRELQEGDLSPGQGFLSLFSSLTEVRDLDLKQRLKIYDQIKREGSFIFIAISDEADSKGKIVGTVKLLLDQKFFRGGAMAAHLEDLVTHPDFGERGIASALCRVFIEKAKELRCYKIILDCSLELVPFYKKQGFSDFEVCLRVNP